MTKTVEELKIMHSEEYKAYMKALCRLASQYVSRIRVQFAEKAFNMYQNETIRRLVLAYGEEAEKLDADRLRDFSFVSEHISFDENHLEDSCLNHAGDYGQSIFFLFDIQ